MSTGMRVRVRWASPTTGRIQDIACFEPLSAEEAISWLDAHSEEYVNLSTAAS